VRYWLAGFVLVLLSVIGARIPEVQGGQSILPRSIDYLAGATRLAGICSFR